MSARTPHPGTGDPHRSPRAPAPRPRAAVAVDRDDEVDLRMLGPALGAWSGAVVATRLELVTAVSVTTAAVLVCLVLSRVLTPLRRRSAWVGLTLVLLLTSVVLGSVRTESHRRSFVAELAQDGATVRAVARVTTDPRVVRGTFGSATVFAATLVRAEARGRAVTLRAPVTVWVRGDPPIIGLGEEVEVVGRARPADDSAHAATLSATSVRPRPGGDPAWWWDAAGSARAAVSASVASRGHDVSALVPALVHGDDHALPDDLRAAFQTSGLTHLLAVSGTNLTLLVGFLLALARPLGAGPRSRVVLAVLATVAYVLLARPEPSVVRAAIMGLVGVAGLSTGGRRRGARCLAWAVVAVVVLDPWLATSAGFLLSAVATGGILLLAPVWRDALARWMPRWLAEAVAVPAAAQLACTAPVAALSGEVSVVAVVANLLAAPAVGPATVLGLSGGLLGLVWAPSGAAVGLVTALPAGWIVLVGRRAADLPGAAATVGDGPVAVSALVVVSAAIAVTGHRLLRRPVLTCLVLAAVTAVTVAPLRPGWPPRGWVMVACDVGQGDATVLKAGPGSAVVVDAGPDARSVDRCLRDLGVRNVPAMLVTHDHADHVDGLPGVTRRRSLAWIGAGPSSPDVTDVPVRELTAGDRWRAGEVTLTVLGPLARPGPSGVVPTAVTEDTANDASLVLLAETSGVRVLLTGDVEPPAQRALAAAYPTLQVDVLKVPHHGSAHQEVAWLTGLGARWATVSAGEGNTYGHPAPETLQHLRDAGATILRTDPGRDVAVVVRDGQVSGVVR
ncbi:ComEC/Rec2 family competence protein [Mumia sp. zg.B53]|uniref:ComEC/Rec2 family competence protein n=1 Tax=Mumia sp. zg.B53 TaxID=2855449 RepID=UPI001C6E5B86|nr:ComEC/Rec2 family competence protein [Mumia sp. zg.B53]MBW9215832.1 ComEC/Rec2 family competence protein [Mumia sp. zg.B53]